MDGRRVKCMPGGPHLRSRVPRQAGERDEMQSFIAGGRHHGGCMYVGRHIYMQRAGIQLIMKNKSMSANYGFLEVCRLSRHFRTLTTCCVCLERSPGWQKRLTVLSTSHSVISTTEPPSADFYSNKLVASNQALLEMVHNIEWILSTPYNLFGLVRTGPTSRSVRLAIHGSGNDQSHS